MRVVEDVGQAEDELVARPVGDEQGVFVLYADEAGAVALGRHVLISLRVRGGEQQERRAADEVDARLVERRPQFVRHEVAGGADQLPKSFLTGDAVRVCVCGHGAVSFRAVWRGRSASFPRLSLSFYGKAGKVQPFALPSFEGGTVHGRSAHRGQKSCRDPVHEPPGQTERAVARNERRRSHRAARHGGEPRRGGRGTDGRGSRLLRGRRRVSHAEGGRNRHQGFDAGGAGRCAARGPHVAVAAAPHPQGDDRRSERRRGRGRAGVGAVVRPALRLGPRQAGHRVRPRRLWRGLRHHVATHPPSRTGQGQGTVLSARHAGRGRRAAHRLGQPCISARRSAGRGHALG